ncbi:MAG: rubredoxin-NAD(+) reductase [Lasallia pustulata]|uniref:Aif-like mitochondrial oxidoreductase n=1 Tax=Lasallia pustulata TaxID=136370 RepID=A0A1W5CY35_9LECA|nr:MAG: rubredoxin-NAD(+) reductase [Lasallia pustulata]SLM35662.1 aif-like mitochondrial oxidoreductase [Lasallia pustulata]
MAQEYKLKGISALDLKDGEKREVEVHGVEEGKVLLVKQGGKTHAMSSNCTHYGAPLKLGVLTPDGRLTCAWHGACFKVDTGDVEDAPALDPLAKFEIAEKDGAVYIKGEESTIKSNRRSPNYKCSAQGQEKVVIVGGGSGTVGALHALREQGFKGPITVISKEPNLPLDRTKLSKALMVDASKLEWRPKEWYDEASIEMVSDEVSGVDFGSKKLSTASGKEYPYTKLILATGGTPKALPLPGFKELQNIFLLRFITDAQAIMSAAGEEKGKKIVVIGSSFIGMEVANCLSQKGHTVTVVGMETAPMERIMGAEVGSIFQKLLEKNGVKFRMGANVEKATPSPSQSSHVGAVHLKDGTTLAADLVILGVGVRPATDFLKGKVDLLDDGSLRTNESFQVAGLTDVYAIGDIATYPYHGPGGNGTPTRIEHWNVAQNAGRSVAACIAHPGAKPKSFIPVFWSALGLQLRYCGNAPGGWDEVMVKGSKDEAKFAAFYTKGETVVAVACMQMDPVMTKCAELMRRGGMPGKRELEGGVDVLELGLPGAVKI